MNQTVISMSAAFTYKMETTKYYVPCDGRYIYHLRNDFIGNLILSVIKPLDQTYFNENTGNRGNVKQHHEATFNKTQTMGNCKTNTVYQIARL